LKSAAGTLEMATGKPFVYFFLTHCSAVITQQHKAVLVANKIISKNSHGNLGVTLSQLVEILKKANLLEDLQTWIAKSLTDK
jgi:hypothetical protein